MSLARKTLACRCALCVLPLTAICVYYCGSVNCFGGSDFELSEAIRSAFDMVCALPSRKRRRIISKLVSHDCVHPHHGVNPSISSPCSQAVADTRKCHPVCCLRILARALFNEPDMTFRLPRPFWRFCPLIRDRRKNDGGQFTKDQLLASSILIALAGSLSSPKQKRLLGKVLHEERLGNVALREAAQTQAARASRLGTRSARWPEVRYDSSGERGQRGAATAQASSFTSPALRCTMFLCRISSFGKMCKRHPG